MPPVFTNLYTKVRSANTRPPDGGWGSVCKRTYAISNCGAKVVLFRHIGKDILKIGNRLRRFPILFRVKS